MPFGVKNVRATYQWAMNAIFPELIGKSMKVYINDIVAKSTNFEKNLGDLEDSLLRMRFQKLKMNPKKCAFGVSTGNLWVFLSNKEELRQTKTKLKQYWK